MKLIDNLYFYPEQGMLNCNTYVIGDSHAIIIDPGSAQSLPALVEDLLKDGINLENIDIITNTHLHGDHCWANEAFKKLSKAQIAIHPMHKEFYDITVIEAAKFFGFQAIEFKEDSCLDYNKLMAGNLEFELIHSPGHTPDSICYYCKKEGILICGDVMFNQNIGRIDLPGGSAGELKQSLERLSQLEIEYLLPGHMDIIIGAEKVRRNFEFIKESVLQWL